MGELRISLLGSFQASFDDRPLAPFRTSKVQALLIYLAVEALSEPTVTHRREALMELLWPGLPLKSAQDNLRQTLYQLRKAIPQQATGDGQSAIHHELHIAGSGSFFSGSGNLFRQVGARTDHLHRRDAIIREED